MKFGKILYVIVMVLLVLIFAGSAFYVGHYYLQSNQQKEEYDDLAAIVENAKQHADESTPDVTAPPLETLPEDEPQETMPPVILPEYQELYDMNSDLVGWIKIEGTRVNYPVMQTPDSPDYYLKRNFNHVRTGQGCIYVREECDVFAPSDNVTIYGHRMKDGSMFETLGSYWREAFWKEHDTIIFDTLYEHHTYQIFAVFRTTASRGEGFRYHLFVDAEDEEAFNEYVATCKELAYYDTGITPVYGDKLITLSTCEYSQANGRLVVVAVRID